MIRTIAAALAAFALISFGARAEDAAAAPAATDKKTETKATKKHSKKAMKKSAKKADAAPATTDAAAPATK